MRVAGRHVRCRSLPPAASAIPAPLGCPLLLLHGLGCSADAWEQALRCLAPLGLAQGVIAPDMPGYGHSEGPPEALDIEALADWTAALLDALGIARAHVAGHSMGCQVALALACLHPERVGGLVLIGPTLGGGYVPGGRYALGVLADGLREPLWYTTILLHMYFQMGIPRFFATFGKMLREDTLAGARRVNAPCLVVRGDGDLVIPDSSARRLAAALPRGVFLRVACSGHAVQFSQPARFAQVALAFLAGTESPALAPPRVPQETPAAPRRLGLALGLLALTLIGLWALRRRT